MLDRMRPRPSYADAIGLLAILALAAVAVAGCGGDDSAPSEPEPADGQAATGDVRPAPGADGAEQTARDWYVALFTFDKDAFCELTTDAAVEDMRAFYSDALGQEIEELAGCAEVVDFLRQLDVSGDRGAADVERIETTPIDVELGPDATSAELSIRDPERGDELGVELEVLDGRWTVTGVPGLRGGDGGETAAATDPCELLDRRQVSSRLPGPAGPEPDLGWSGGQCRWQVDSDDEPRIIVGLAPWSEFGELTEGLNVSPEPLAGLGDEALLLEGTVAPGTFSADGRTLHVRRGMQGIGIVWDRTPDPPPSEREMRALAEEVLGAQ